MISGPSGRVPLGYTDEEENVRDFDERAQRFRIASRAGLLPLGSTSPCPAGSPVTHMFTSRRPVPKRVWADLTDVDQADTIPSRRKIEWSTVSERICGQAVLSDGAIMRMETDGSVYTLNPETGEATLAFSVQVPVRFSLVECLAVDSGDGAIVMATNPLEIDGGATRAYRFTADQDGVWSQEYEEVVLEQVIKFWYSSGDIFATTRPPATSDGDGTHSLTRYGGTQTTAWSTLWQTPVPEPLNAMAFRGSDVFFAAGRNSSRQRSDTGASVDWTPRELTNASQRLFSWLSADHLRGSLGYQSGQDVPNWPEARFEDSDFPDIIDTTDRSMTCFTNNTGLGPQPQVPTFRVDPEGNGHEVEFNTDTIYFDGLSSTNLVTSKLAKGEVDASMPAHGGLQPNVNFNTWANAVLVRLEESEALRHPPEDYWVIYLDGKYELRYKDHSTHFDLTLYIDGDTPVERTVSLPAGEKYACAVWVNAPGTDQCYFRVNGAQVGLPWTQQASFLTGNDGNDYAGSLRYRSQFGADYTDFFNAKFRGGIKETCVFFGDTTNTAHDTAPTSAEIEQIEGYQCHAHGLGSILPTSHPYDSAPPPTTGSGPPGPSAGDAYADVRGLVAKVKRGDGAFVWSYADTDSAGQSIAVDSDDGVFSIGVENEVVKIEDQGTSGVEAWTVALTGSSGTVINQRYVNGMFASRSGRVTVGWAQVDITSVPYVYSFYLTTLENADGAQAWQDTAASPVFFIDGGGLYVDDTAIAGPNSEQFLVYSTQDNKGSDTSADAYLNTLASGATVRTDLIGQQRTGETKDQEIELVAVCESGTVARLIQDDIDDSGTIPVLTKRTWYTLDSNFNPGDRPWSFELYGKHYVGGPDEYRAYDPRLKTWRDWTPTPSSVIPQRIFTAVRWRGRAIVVSEDTPNILFGSAYGDPLNFNTGGDVISATQAFAGTTAEAGAIPDPIVALVPSNDDLLFVGTTRSVWRLTGDPQTGGQLDDVLATEGILDTFSWCRGDAGEMYWATTSLRIVRATTNGLEDISEAIRPILQAIDPRKMRVELHWAQRMRGLYVIFVPRDNTAKLDVQHLFWSSRTGGWHPTSFAGGAGRAIRSAHSLDSADPSGWGVAFGFFDGQPRIEHPEALDDDGVAIASRMRIPLGGDGDPQMSLVTQAELVLDPAQGPVRVVGGAARTGEGPAQYGVETLAQPGRGDRVQVQVSGNSTWLELSGASQPWAMDDLAVHIHPWGVG